MLGQKNQISKSIPEHLFAQPFFCPTPKIDSAIDQQTEIHLGKKMLEQKNQISRSIPDHVFAQPFFWVHPGLPWVKVESTAVEKDGYFEVLSITKAACSSLDGHDLTVDAFGY